MVNSSCTLKELQEHNIELADGEFILHVEGTARTQRVTRHIGATSWSGRLTLTNQALYFEASGVVSYEDAIKIELSKPNVDHQVKSVATGPWGAPLFDKAMAYESSELEWVGYSLAAFIVWCAGMMQWARHHNVHEKCIDIVISTVNPEQTIMS